MKLSLFSRPLAILIAFGFIACSGQNSNIRTLKDKLGSENVEDEGKSDDSTKADDNTTDDKENDKTAEEKVVDQVEDAVDSVADVIDQAEDVISQAELDMKTAKELQEARAELADAKALLASVTTDNAALQQRITELDGEISLLEKQIQAGLALFEYIAITHDFQIRETIVADIDAANLELSDINLQIANLEDQIVAADAKVTESQELVNSLGGDIDALLAELKLIVEPSQAEVNLIELIEAFQAQSALLAEKKIELDATKLVQKTAEQKLENLNEKKTAYETALAEYQAEKVQLEADLQPLLADSTKKAEREAIAQQILIIDYLIANLEFEIRCKTEEISIAELELTAANADLGLVNDSVLFQQDIVDALKAQLGTNLSAELAAAEAQLALDIEAATALKLDRIPLSEKQSATTANIAELNELLETWDALLLLVSR